MGEKRQVEIFSAGCGLCRDVERLVRELACESCAVTVLDMKDAAVAERSSRLGVTSLPAIAIDGRLVSCCEQAGVNADALRAAGLGQPRP